MTKLHAAFGDANEIYVHPNARGEFPDEFGGDYGSSAAGPKKPAPPPQLRGLQFAIRHYAGTVIYSADSWLDKNRGALQPELVKLLAGSRAALLSAAFTPLLEQCARQPPTTGSAFRASLRELSAMIARTTAFYIRCIKPNREKVPEAFAGRFIERQLRYTGISAVTQMYRVGYPSSVLKQAFVTRYLCIAFCLDRSLLTARLSLDELCTRLLQLAQADGATGDATAEDGEGASWLKDKDAQLGKTKLFMRETVLKVLEQRRQAASNVAVVRVQMAMRARLARRTLLLMRTLGAQLPPVREALERKAMEASSANLAVAQATWGSAGGLPRAVAALLPWRRQLQTLEAKAETLRLHQSVIDSLPEEARGEGMEVVELTVGSEPVPKEGRIEMNGFEMDVKLMTTICKGGLGLGVQFNAANTVMSILKIGPAAAERKLRVGDIVIKVDGSAVVSTKESFLDAEQGKSYQLVIARKHDEEADAAEAVPPHDAAIIIQGWLMTVDASVDGRALQRPQSRFVVLEGGGKLTWFEDAERSRVSGGQTLLGARCSVPGAKKGQLPFRSGKQHPDVAERSPVLTSFAEDYHKLPWVLTWRDGGGPPHDVVFAAGSSVERARWVAAVMNSLAAVNDAEQPALTPIAGWLMKQGGRRSGRKRGWKKRWFVLPPDGTRVSYYTSASAGRERGAIPLAAPADVFQAGGAMRGPAGYPYAFCLSTTENRATQSVVLAASSQDDLEAWLTALRRCLPAEEVPEQLPKILHGKQLAIELGDVASVSSS